MDKLREDPVAQIREYFQTVTDDLRLLVDIVTEQSKAWRESAGPVPTRTLQLRLPGHPLTREPGMDIVVVWTPAGLSIYENGKRFLGDQPFMVIEVMPPTPRIR